MGGRSLVRGRGGAPRRPLRGEPGVRKVALIVAGSLVAAGPAVAASRASTRPPSFVSYYSPQNKGNGAGEPSIGVDLRTGAVMFQAGLQTLRVTGFDQRGNATWADVSDLSTSVVSL